MKIFPKYLTVEDWGTLTSMKRSLTYEAMGDGRLRAVKLGGKTLIDVEHGLAYMASLPQAKLSDAHIARKANQRERATRELVERAAQDAENRAEARRSLAKAHPPGMP